MKSMMKSMVPMKEEKEEDQTEDVKASFSRTSLNEAL